MKWLLLVSAVCLVTFTLLTVDAQPPATPRLELKPGDHICLLGNSTAERMQHYGWLETFLHSRFPQHHLSIRNLGFAGDTLTTRLRSMSFGTPDEWLNRCQADVIFAFFGYNESFAGEEGLPQFKADLKSFIEHTLSQKYNAKSAPRLVLFAPLAHEDLKSPHLPDGTVNNARLALYTKALREAAIQHQLPFCELFELSGKLYLTNSGLTVNGVHLNERGDQVIGQAIDLDLFRTAQTPETEYLARLRAAVNDKDMHWFQRYRTTDGYSIYGGRADLKFVNDQTNREVAQREMEVLDVMTANRDKHIWNLAQKQQSKVDDSNLPKFIPVISNKPGKGPNGQHLFLCGEEAIKSMTIAKGFKVNLFADEKMFPDLINPVQMQFDTRGRLWVATWQTYPHWKPTEAMNDKLLILEDTDGDGKADKCTTFAGDLHNPTGFEFYNGGVIVAQAPNVVFLKDNNGDGKYDQKDILLTGIDSADTHHTSNSFVFGPDGAIYFQEGTFHQTSIETPYSAPVRCSNAGVFRYEPRTQKFETYVSFGFANPHGHVFDRWGRDIVVDGTGSNPYHAALFSGRVEYPNKHARPPQVYQQWTRPCSGMEILSSKHFPEELQGNLLVLNVIGYQGILMYKLRDKGASIEGLEDTRLLSSSDPNFRPADVKIGPDGAIYFCDWHNPIIGHMQHNLRDPNRDRTHGRVYRITCEGKSLSQPVTIAGEPIEKLVPLLAHPEDRVRYRVRVELSGRNSRDVLRFASDWLDTLAKQPGDHTHEELEVLWLHQQHNSADIDLIKRLLNSKHGHARAATVRVLSYLSEDYVVSPRQPGKQEPQQPSRKTTPTEKRPPASPQPPLQKKYDDKPPPTKQEQYAKSNNGPAVTHLKDPDDPESLKQRSQSPGKIEKEPEFPRNQGQSQDLLYRGPINEWPNDALKILLEMAKDPDPKVRLEVARAASFFTIPEAVEVPLTVMEQPMDQYLTFVCNETMKTLEPLWRRELAAGKTIRMRTEVGNRFLVKKMSTASLLKKERSFDVCQELLTRPGIQDEYRLDALRGLGRMRHRSAATILVDTLASLDQVNNLEDKSIYFDLVRLLSGRAATELAEVRGPLEKLALTAQQAVIRQVGYLAIMTVDNQIASAWKLAGTAKNPLQAEQDVVTATTMLSDTSLRNQAYDRLIEVLQRTAAASASKQPVMGRYVRVELPGKQRTLTLAEVEVYSQGKNIARQGKATQQNIAHGGAASRAIDGNKSGRYSDGGQTHTSEASTDPWWELDLGRDFPLDSISIYNRTEDSFYRRLNGFHLKVLDSNRQTVWDKTNQPAPEKVGQYEIVSIDPQAALRKSAMLAMTTVRGQEKKTFTLLAAMVKNDPVALQALLRLPKKTWPVDEAKPVLPQVIDFLKQTPAALRTTPLALEAMELGEALSTLYPADQAKALRRQLLDLGVRVIRVGTLLERMSYDKDVLVVQAGKPVEFIFENTDMMPHNLVIGTPGSLEALGEAAEATATSADAAARHFVPRMKEVLLSSKLLQPRESERLSFTAPKQSGVYPIVCTYPGHWRRMYSALYVVDDLESYQTGQEAYLAAHPLTVKDAMLKDRRPRTEWKTSDLEPLLADLGTGRSFGNGKSMFKVASCVACHRFGGEGNNFAPDLTQIDPKWTRADLLKNIVEPSHLINEKYQTWVFATIDGKTITAIVLEETGDAYKIIENPLTKAEPMLLKKADVEQKQKSNVSTMPKGLLDTLSREEILDLLAYILSKAQPNHELYQNKGHKH
ncbi:MAG: PVC-type heme-binding CxxCH protein [Gemmatales bacterium]